MLSLQSISEQNLESFDTYTTNHRKVINSEKQSSFLAQSFIKTHYPVRKYILTTI